MRCARSWDALGYRNHGALYRPLASTALLLALLALVAGCAAAPRAADSGANQTTATLRAAEQSQLAEAVGRAVASETSQVQMRYGANRTAQATITVGWNATYTANDVPREQERVKRICFAAQKALWTNGVAITDALVIVIGPVTDEYGSPTTGAHGTAELSAPNAMGLRWGTLDPDAAWTHYDHVYLRDTYTFSA